MEKLDKIGVEEIQKTAAKVRVNVVEMLTKAGSGHPGGSLSLADLVSTLYLYKLRHDPANPKWEERDRVVLSKGHAAPVIYSILAELGYFEVKELATLRQYGSILQGHPDMKSTPGIDMSTGSLGQGLSVACGMALAAKLDSKEYRIYVFIGDGESQEGEVWEAAMAAAHYKLDNICVVLDYNKLQIDGKVEDVMSIEPVDKKWEAFGWKVIAIDGHKIPEIVAAYDKAETIKGQPTIIIANTIKGKGVSFMEGNVGFHGKSPTGEEGKQAVNEIERSLI